MLYGNMVGTYRRQSSRSKTGEETVEDRKTTDLPAVREWEAQKLSLIVGDTNDPKCLGFHSMKLRKVRGRSTSPRREQYYIRLRMNALYMVRSSGGPRKYFAR